MNNVVLVGRLVEDPEILVTEKGKKMSAITIAVHRNYKNADGVYETDFIRCVMWNVIAENVCEYCKSGDVVGVKGRIESRSYEDEKNEKKYITEVVAEKITFLSSKKPDEKFFKSTI